MSDIVQSLEAAANTIYEIRYPERRCLILASYISRAQIILCGAFVSFLECRTAVLLKVLTRQIRQLDIGVEDGIVGAYVRTSSDQLI
ncbi:hypothetical protein [Neorhizobium sp. JUb45]|uniref:hypothetical protein n=1 Tax=Neorhizobium sp. JUb45 TaxID=2485113 RepID=UPI00104B0CB5|nr:hypothetical protein [Neorhizobium sp. JUb45]TCQ99018.1 hypothetical protein EDF70_1104 [Neorhizobium sp. JUb45]